MLSGRETNMTFKERVDLHDREIAAIRKLMVTGMKMLVRSEKRTDNLTANMAKHDATIERIEKNLDRLIRSLSNPRNGHSKH